MSAFEERVAETAFDQADAEFAALGREAGIPVLPAREVLAAPTPIGQAREGHGFKGPMVRDGSTFKRRTPHFEPEEEAPDVTRKLRRGSGRREVKFSNALVPVDVTNTDSGQVYKIWVRRVPATEFGYLERLENILNDIRLDMRRLRAIRDKRDQEKLDRLNAEYNRTAEEYLAFQIEMPEGFYADLNTAGLTLLQRQLGEIGRGEDLSEDDAGN